MLVGDPGVENVTLWKAVVPCHSHLTVPFTGTSTIGVNVKSATATVTTEVVVNVAGDPLSPVAVAVAVCSPRSVLRVCVALAAPVPPVKFAGGAIEPPLLVTAQAIATPFVAFP